MHRNKAPISEMSLSEFCGEGLCFYLDQLTENVEVFKILCLLFI